MDGLESLKDKKSTRRAHFKSNPQLETYYRENGIKISESVFMVIS